MFIYNNSNKFLKYFNEIDKQFDIILKTNKFKPFNEKLKEIGIGNYPISNYINKHIKILKHLGELRNELIHGGTIGGKSLIVPTNNTIIEIKKHNKVICNPPSIGQIFENNNIITIKNTDNINNNKKYHYFCKEKTSKKDFFKQYYAPIIDNKGKILKVISPNNIIFIDHNNNINNNNEHFFEYENIHYKIVRENFLLLEVQDFYKNCAKKGLQGIIIITENGQDNAKIKGIITPFNYAKIFKYI